MRTLAAAPLTLRSLATAASLAIVCIGGFVTSPARAGVFFNDFENGLGPNESVGGGFLVNDLYPVRLGGRYGVGHPGIYQNYAYDWYQISRITPQVGSLLEFVYAMDFEAGFDRFNVVAAPSGQLAPPNGLLWPIEGISYFDHGAVYVDEIGNIGFSPFGPQLGRALFDLSPWAGIEIDIRMQVGSDGLIQDQGAYIDDVLITNIKEQNPTVNTTEPHSFLMLGLPWMMLGMYRRFTPPTTTRPS